MRGPPTTLEKRAENRVDPCTVPCLAQAQANDLNLFQRQGFALAEGRDWDPQHDESFLAPNLHRKIGDAHPRLIEVALRLLEAMEAETQGPPHTCRAVRHPGDEASPIQKQCPENFARGAAREGTVKHQMELQITEKKWVWSMVEASGARVRAL